MYKVEGLPGLKEGVILDALFIRKATEVEVALDNHLAITSAGNNGAINIWKDDEHNIRCEAQRYCATIDSQIFEDVEQAIEWAEIWLPQIN